MRNASHKNSISSEPQWPVDLYRYTDCDGWQRQQTQGDTPLSASPRKDSIVLPSLRQKFTLKGDTDHDKSSVIRRNNCILLVSRKRTRAMLLKFASLQDCLEFSDRFCEINHPSLIEQHHNNDDNLAPKGPRNQSQNSSYYNVNPEDGHTEQVVMANNHQAPQVRIEDQEQVLSHIVQLVHNPEFMSFVHKLENYIGSCNDGAQLLKALEVNPNTDDGRMETDTMDAHTNISLQCDFHT
ncbi:unnamed protein product [Cylindrotheca closterium]|uniref:Uncharacterized protein n=1 Tax=Cylindrotheca closterium TaxID=2856 RepID=A0AAD2CMW2_9STRA|nr:unnamed protein product [Cylindrotheca closterium]